jgi:hypothetical protein
MHHSNTIKALAAQENEYIQQHIILSFMFFVIYSLHWNAHQLQVISIFQSVDYEPHFSPSSAVPVIVRSVRTQNRSITIYRSSGPYSSVAAVLLFRAIHHRPNIQNYSS